MSKTWRRPWRTTLKKTMRKNQKVRASPILLRHCRIHNYLHHHAPRFRQLATAAPFALASWLPQVVARHTRAKDVAQHASRLSVGAALPTRSQPSIRSPQESSVHGVVQLGSRQPRSLLGHMSLPGLITVSHVPETTVDNSRRDPVRR